MKSPTALSLELLRTMGYDADVVERWIPNTKTRRDLFGCIDIVAIHPAYGILAVQATSRTNVAARVAKAKEEPRVLTWLQAGGGFEVWGWGDRRVRIPRKDGTKGPGNLLHCRRMRAGLQVLRNGFQFTELADMPHGKPRRARV